MSSVADIVTAVIDQRASRSRGERKTRSTVAATSVGMMARHFPRFLAPCRGITAAGINKLADGPMLLAVMALVVKRMEAEEN